MVLPFIGIPVRFIGTGEGIDDIAPFDADAFIDGLLTSHLHDAAFAKSRLATF